MKKAKDYLNNWINDVSNEQNENETKEYSEREVVEMLQGYKKDQREQLIRYQIKITSCSDEQAEMFVDSYLSSIGAKMEVKEKQKQTFEEVSEIMIKWMAENQHPHTMAEIDSIKAVLWEGKQTHNNTSFITD